MKKTDKEKASKYISTIYILTTVFTVICGLYIYKRTNSVIYSIVFGLLAFIPISEISIQIINYLLVKIVESKIIPKLDFSMRNSRRIFMCRRYTNNNKL